MLAPVGKPGSSEKVRVCPASASVADAVNVSRLPSVTVLLPIAFSTGQALPVTELTVTVIVSKSLQLGVALSVTRIVIGKLPLEAGVHEKMPVEGLITAPAGAPASRLKVRV